MILRATLAALAQLASPPLRGLVLRSVGLALLLLLVLWAVLTKGFGWLLRAHPLSVDYPVVDGFVYFMAGAGLLVALAYMLPVISALVGGFFIDEAALVVEETDFPADRPGAPISFGRSLLYGLRFGGLALLVNLVALILFFIPVVNLVSFFAANAYLLGREYFEMAAARFMPVPEAVALRRAHRGTVLAAGAVLAAFMLVPIVNLATPIFAIALMVHVQKAVRGRPALGEVRRT